MEKQIVKLFFLVALMCVGMYPRTTQASYGYSRQTKIIAGVSLLGLGVYGAYKLYRKYTSKYNSFFNVLINKSNNVQFPTYHNKIEIIAGQDIEKQVRIVDQANHVRPIVDERVLILINNFLKYKQQYGSSIEQKMYATMTTDQFIDRLLTKRPFMFMTISDAYILQNGDRGYGGFDEIGTINETEPLILNDYLSYDEMQIAALFGVSVPTFFINNGSRDNRALPGKTGTFEEQGIYVGLVGARFEKVGLMEWRHMIITPQQNNAHNGYGANADQKNPKTKLLSLWSNLYGETFATFEQVQADKSERYISLGLDTYLDTVVYKKRMKMVIEPFLVDANDRGKQEDKKVYCHVVGLGLGVWQKTPLQAKLMLEVYADIIKNRDLSFISDLDFSWFPVAYKTCGGVKNGQVFTTEHNQITIHFSKRNPADKLVRENKGKLLVAMYAWDANAYPGNEYWAGYLTASGDPAAACCSTIAELQNPLINSNVSAKHLWITHKRKDMLTL